MLKGVLSKDSAKAVDDLTVEFHLDAPNGNFPYYVSSDNFNAVILPANFAGTYEKSFIGTGPLKFEKYTPKVGASFVRNPDYWGDKALPQRVTFAFYADQQAQLLALQGRQADVMGDFTVQGGAADAEQPRFQGARREVERASADAHAQRQAAVQGQARAPGARARRWIARCMVKGLFQRPRDARQRQPVRTGVSVERIFPCRSAGSMSRRRSNCSRRPACRTASTSRSTTEKYMEIPDLAVVIQNAAKAIGVRMTLKVESQELYYGAGTFGKSDWLDSPLGITDYGHRGVPNVFLNAPLTSGGTWNAAHFKNPQYDKLVADFVGGARRRVAEEALRADPDPAARRNAARDSVLLRLSGGDAGERRAACASMRTRSFISTARPSVPDPADLRAAPARRTQPS